MRRKYLAEAVGLLDLPPASWQCHARCPNELQIIHFLKVQGWAHCEVTLGWLVTKHRTICDFWPILGWTLGYLKLTSIVGKISTNRFNLVFIKFYLDSNELERYDVTLKFNTPKRKFPSWLSLSHHAHVARLSQSLLSAGHTAHRLKLVFRSTTLRSLFTKYPIGVSNLSGWRLRRTTKGAGAKPYVYIAWILSTPSFCCRYWTWRPDACFLIS